MFAAPAVSHWIEHQTGWSIKKFIRAARRYRTVQIQAGRQTLTAAAPRRPEVWLGVPGCSCGAGASVAGEEVIDDAGAVLVVDNAQTGHPREQQRPHELAHGTLEVELVEFGVRFGTLQDGLERLDVVVDDACLQCAVGCLAVLPVIAILGIRPQG